MALNVANVDVQLTASAAVILAAQPNAQLTILKATACNTNTNPRTLTVYRVPDLGSPGATNLLIDGLAIGAGATVILPLSGQTLLLSQSLQALADMAAKLNLSISYASTP